MASPLQHPALAALGGWLSRRNLWLRLALGLSLGFLALFAAFSALGELALQQSAERIRAERLVIAQITAFELDQLLAQAVAELERVRAFADFDPADPDRAAETAILAHTYSPSGPFSAGIAFLDSRGVVIEALPPTLGADLGSMPFVREALASRQTSISEPFPNPAGDRPLAAVSVPIFAGERFIGLLTGLIDLGSQPVAALLDEAATIGRSGHAVIFDSAGRSLASTYPVPLFAPGEHGAFFREAMARGTPVVASVPYELDLPGEPLGHPHVMAAAFLLRAPWGVAVGGDEDETYAGLGWLRLGLIALALGALSAIWGATLFGARRLVRPVQRLTAAAERIAAGDLQTPLAASEGGEIGAMARALEHMRVQLLASIDDLAALNSSLESRVAERTDELRLQTELTHQLLGRVITAQEDERARLARELHDEIGQMLTALQLSLDRLAKSLPPDAATSRERLGSVRELSAQTLADLRRVIADLRPGVLDKLGLVPALAWVAEHTVGPLGIEVSVEASGLVERLPVSIETVLFRIAQEAMHNVARHSGASRVRITLNRSDAEALMAIHDDGRGFTPELIAPSADGRGGLGLAGMAERAALAGGQISISSAPDQGTSIRVSVPLPPPVPAPSEKI